MKQRPWTRILSLVLVLTLVLGLVPADYATGSSERTVTFEEISPDEVTAELALEENQASKTEKEERNPEEIVRVSIVVEGHPLLEQGCSTMALASNQKA